MTAAGESNPGAPGHAGVDREQRMCSLLVTMIDVCPGVCIGASTDLARGFPAPTPTPVNKRCLTPPIHGRLLGVVGGADSSASAIIVPHSWIAFQSR
jgi:hypothetical protein